MARRQSSAEVRKAFATPIDSLAFEIYRLNPPVIGLRRKAGSEAGVQKPLAEIRGLVTKKIETFVSKHSGKLKTIICEKLHYCDLIESEPLQLAKEIADAIAMETLLAHGFVPIPPIRIAAFFVRTDILSRLCKCHDCEAVRSTKKAANGQRRKAPAPRRVRVPIRRLR